jgi:hypothetical protein
MNNYKLMDVMNLKMTVEKRQGYQTYVTKYDETGKTKFKVGRLIDWNTATPDDGNFESCAPEKGVKRDDWKWAVTKYDSNKFDSKYSWKVDVEGEGEGYIDLNEKQNKLLTACIAGISEEDDAVVKVKKEAMETKSGQAYSAYKFTLLSSSDKPE